MLTQRRRKILNDLIYSKCTYQIRDCDGDSYRQLDIDKLLDYLSSNITEVSEIIKNENYGV